MKGGKTSVVSSVGMMSAGTFFRNKILRRFFGEGLRRWRGMALGLSGRHLLCVLMASAWWRAFVGELSRRTFFACEARRKTRVEAARTLFADTSWVCKAPRITGVAFLLVSIGIFSFRALEATIAGDVVANIASSVCCRSCELAQMKHNK